MATTTHNSMLKSSENASLMQPLVPCIKHVPLHTYRSGGQNRFMRLLLSSGEIFLAIPT